MPPPNYLPGGKVQSRRVRTKPIGNNGIPQWHDGNNVGQDVIKASTGAMAVIRYARLHGTKRLWLALSWNAGQSGSLLSLWPTRSHVWPGP
jgi:hypothetical protein